MNNLKLLSKRCHEAFSNLKNPVFMRVFGVFGIIPTLQRMFDSKQICLEFVSTFAFCYTDCLYYPECFDSCYHCVITFDNRVSISHILNDFNRILSFFSYYTKYFFVLTACFVAIIEYALLVNLLVVFGRCFASTCKS